MSEMINNSQVRKSKLKELILKLHSGEEEQKVRQELLVSLSQVPYGEVVEVEQELINEGLPIEEVLRLCDAHSAVLQGHVDLTSQKAIPEGHPIDVMFKENIEIKKVTDRASKLLHVIRYSEPSKLSEEILGLRSLFNSLLDVDKHYQRKEYLLFPYLEKKGISGPPKVMWGKHDEIRELIRGSLEILKTEDVSKDELLASAEIILKPALKGIEDMVVKEEEILFPMALDNLEEIEWYQISKQSLEIGFCLYDPPKQWKPELTGEADMVDAQQTGKTIQLPSGRFTNEELLSILNTLPVDLTFVDKDDKVKYFSQNSSRIFQRNRAILNRDVRNCHPPASVHIVDKIIEDFKSGRENRAPFWINMGGRFIHIEYFALRNEKGEYLGTLEVSQDLTEYQSLEGEQRILSYATKGKP